MVTKYYCGVMAATRHPINAVEKPTGKKSKDNDETSSWRLHHEDEVDKLTMELMKLHGDKYTYPAYKVWARMIKNSQWDKMDDPPPIKMISGKSAKKDKDSVLISLLVLQLQLCKH